MDVEASASGRNASRKMAGFGDMQYRDSYEQDAILQLNNWMSKIDGKANLCQLSIPGTHDSHSTARNWVKPTDGRAADAAKVDPEQVKAFSVTQYFEIYQQLRAGVRFLDLRVGGDLNMRHGIIPLVGTLEQVLDTIHQYLEDKEHPNETVLVSIMKDGGPDGDIHSLVKRKWDQYKWYADEEWPILENVRGKAVLFRRYEGKEYGIDGGKFYDDKDRLGPNIQGQWTQAEVQNGNEAIEDKRAKWDRVWPHLDAALHDTRTNVMYFHGLANNKPATDLWEGLKNHFSDEWTTPEYYAASLNVWFMQEMAKPRMNVDVPLKQRFGVIMLDCLKLEHCVKIISKNFVQEIVIQSRDWVDPGRVHDKAFENGVHIEWQKDGHLVVYSPTGKPLWAVPVRAPNPEQNNGVKMHWSGNELAMFEYTKNFLTGPVHTVEDRYFQAGRARLGAKLRWIAGPPYIMIDIESDAGDIVYCSIPGDLLANQNFGVEGISARNG